MCLADARVCFIVLCFVQFCLIALLGGTATVFGFIGHVLAGSVWAIFHILIVLLQGFIFMMLTLVYIGQAHEGH